MQKPVNVLRIARDDPDSWAVMPQVLDRVMRCCREMETETDPFDARDLILAWFAAASPLLALWSAVDEGRVGAHFWITLEPIGAQTPRYALVRQVEVDARLDIREAGRSAFEEAKRWVASLGLHRIMMLTHRRAESFARRHGFVQRKVLMEYCLDGSVRPMLPKSGS
mgnify:CR=1 FL=1